jgi:integrase/recombinase XerC
MENQEHYGRPESLEQTFIKFPKEQQTEITNFLEQLSMNRASTGTIKQYRFYLIRLYESTQKPLTQTTKEDIKKFIKQVVKTGQEGTPIKHTTQKVMYSALNTYFKFYDKNELRLDRREVYGSDEVPLEIFTKKDRDEFFEKTKELFGLKWLTIFEVSYWEAFRIDDVINFKTKNIDFKNNKILITGGKGNKDAIIELFPRAKQRLEEYMQSEYFNPNQEYVFMYDYKKGKKAGKSSRFYPHLIEQRFHAVLAELGIGKLMSFHTLRHSCATHIMIATKGDIGRVQQHLRHKQGSTVTLRYLNLMRQGFNSKEINELESDLL